MLAQALANGICPNSDNTRQEARAMPQLCTALATFLGHRSRTMCRTAACVAGMWLQLLAEEQRKSDVEVRVLLPDAAAPRCFAR